MYVRLWSEGYSISELWGEPPPPVTRGTSNVDASDCPDWGMLAAIDYKQGGWGAGDNYLRERLSNGDWIALGYKAPRNVHSPLLILPQHIFPQMQFGGDHSSVFGDGLDFVGVRVIHAEVLADLAVGGIEAKGPGRPSMRIEIVQAYEQLREFWQDRLQRGARETCRSNSAHHCGETWHSAGATERRRSGDRANDTSKRV